MNRREFCASLAAGGAALAMPKWLLGAEGGPASARPNILFIMTDQQFGDAMSCRMGRQYLSTPVMRRADDNMAESLARSARGGRNRPYHNPAEAPLTGQGEIATM